VGDHLRQAAGAGHTGPLRLHRREAAQRVLELGALRREIVEAFAILYDLRRLGDEVGVAELFLAACARSA
jgi:hypothetical protein